MNELLNTARFSLTEMSSAVIIFNILLTFALSMFIAFVYKKTHRSVSYSQSFISSLIMMSVLSAVAMMILGNNLTRALGVLGVFTLIRFRTIVKDPKDATYLFFALAIGMAIGTNNYTIAIISTFLMSGINYFLDRSNFASMVDTGFLLTLVVDKKFESDELTALGKKYLRSIGLLQLKTEESGENTHHYKIRFTDTVKYEDFLLDLKNLKGVKIVDLISGRDSAEY